MKRYALIIAVSMIAASPAPVYAQTNAEKIQDLEATVASFQNTMDSLDIVISDMMETFDEKMSLIESQEREIVSLQDGYESKTCEIGKYSDIAMKWACLLLFAVFLPILLARLYIGKSKEDQRRYDIIVDLVRSGVDIKPEMREYLTGSSGAVRNTLRTGVFSGLAKADIDYCSKRILWAVCLLVIGFTISVISSEGIVFGIFACISVIFLAQAVVRYFSLKYFNEHKAKEDQENAE